MNRSELKSHQEGMVAIVTTMILMIVISIIVLGFSQVVRRNQRQVLDTQLSSQAFYAAESGINLAKSKLSTDSSFRSNDCAGNGLAGPNGDKYKLDGDNVAITCVMVQGVDTIEIDKITTTSKVSLIQPEGGANVGSLYINWESSNPDSAVNNVNQCSTNMSDKTLPVNWSCGQPMLRVDLVPLAADGTTMTRSELLSKQFTAFLYPKRANSPTVTAFNWADGIGANKGAILPISCSNSLGNNLDKKHKCTLDLNNLPGSASSPVNRFAIRIMSVYGEADTDIHVEGNPKLEGAQMLVDSTGRAADVLKRVQVRIPINGVPGLQLASFAVDTAGPLCKRYQLMAGDTLYGTLPAGCQL